MPGHLGERASEQVKVPKESEHVRASTLLLVSTRMGIIYTQTMNSVTPAMSDRSQGKGRASRLEGGQAPLQHRANLGGEKVTESHKTHTDADKMILPWRSP